MQRYRRAKMLSLALLVVALFDANAMAVVPRLDVPTWNTFVGGGYSDYGRDVAVDASGNVYVTGKSEDTWGEPLSPYAPFASAYVAKFDPAGTLLWNTFLGEEYGDRGGSGIAVDASGNVFVTGAIYRNYWYDGHYDAFVAKLDGNGVLVWNTFLGESYDLTSGADIATDATGSVYVTGQSALTWGNPIREHGGGFRDGFVTKLDASGAVVWNTFLGGSDIDVGTGIAVDASGNVAVSGISYSTWGAPVSPLEEPDDAFVALLDADGALLWSTFLGAAASYDSGKVAMDAHGNIHVTGSSQATWGNPVREFSGEEGSLNAYVAKLDLNGVLLWNTFLGGASTYDEGRDVAVDLGGNVYATGDSWFSWGDPIRPWAGYVDAYVVKLDADGTLIWNTFLGSADWDQGDGIAVDASGDLTVAGFSSGTWGTPLRPWAGVWDAFVARIRNPRPVADDLALSGLEDATMAVTLSASDPEGDPLTYTVVTGPLHGTVSGTAPNLTYEPGADYSGSDSITYKANDNPADSNTATVAITITPVNDAPSFAGGSDQIVVEDAGTQTVSGWATAMSAGPANEAGQALSFTVTNDNSVLFSGQPAVGIDGALTFTPAADAYGSAIVTVALHDDGGTTNGGVDASVAQTFTITVAAVNDAPTLDALLPLTIDEDVGQQTVGLAGITAGPGEIQTLTVTATSSNTGVIPHPAVTYTSPEAIGTLVFTPVAGTHGSATITVTVDDGQSTNNTVVRTFAVTVNAVNHAPTGVAFSGSLVAQDAAAGTVVGTLSTADVDAGDSFTYSLVAGTGDADNASFEVAGSELRVLAAPDFRVRNPYSVRVRSTDAGGLSMEQTFTISTPEYALWTRSDTGQAALWQVRPDTGSLIGGTYLYVTSGVGRPWQATSYQSVSDTDGYVLWTRSDTGQAALWQIDPSLPTGAAQLKRSAFLYTAFGVGRPWQATSYQHVSDTDGYVLWTRSDTGQAALWQIDPSLPAGAAQLKRSMFLYPASGVGGSWQATGYQHVSDTEGYVLWTRSDTGQAALWQIDPSLPAGAAQLKRSVFLYVKSGVGGPWQATSYTHVSATEGYVLWTRSDTGQAAVWKLDPSQATGAGQLARSWYLHAKAGVGGPWQATSHVRLGPVSAAVPDSGEQRKAVETLAR